MKTIETTHKATRLKDNNGWTHISVASPAPVRGIVLVITTDRGIGPKKNGCGTMTFGFYGPDGEWYVLANPCALLPTGDGASYTQQPVERWTAIPQFPILEPRAPK